MKKLLLVLVLTAFCAYGATKKPDRDLMILLDFGQSEEVLRSELMKHSMIHGAPRSALAQLGAMTCTMIPALYQKAAPMIVSKSLLYSLIARKKIFKDCLTLDIAQLSRRYGHQKISRAPSLGVFKQHCLYGQRMYNSIKSELSTILKTGTPQEISKAIDTLTSKHPYLEASAPRSLQHYSDRRSIKEDMHQELQAYALCYYAPLSSKDFIIKEVSSELALLVPRNYISGLTDTEYKETATITPLEKRLGIKLNHLKDITLDDLFKKTPITFKIPLCNHLTEILVTKKEGSSHTWAVYMTGHGLPTYKERKQLEDLEKLNAFYDKQLKAQPAYRQRLSLSQRKSRIEENITQAQQTLKYRPTTHENIICSIPATEFQAVLRFLNTQVNTSILLYTSCFGGGEHLVIPYTNDTEKLSFDCISGSVSDAESYQDTPMLLLPPYKCIKGTSEQIIQGISEDSFDTHNKCLAPFSTVHFGEFFKGVRTTVSNAFNLIHCLHPYTNTHKKRHAIIPRFLENIALERPAGSTSFTLAGPCPALVSAPPSGIISSEADVLFFEKPSYGTIKLSGSLPISISLTPGPAYHVIDSLEAQKHALSSVLDSFLELKTLNSPKLFWIKKLVCKKDSSLPFLPFDIIRSVTGGSHAELYDVIIARNIPTSDGLKHRVTSSIYFSDAKGTTWHIPVYQKLGSCSRAARTYAHAELYTLFPGLRDATLKRQVKLKANGVSDKRPLAVKAPFNPRAY